MRPGSHRDDINQVGKALEIVAVARVEPGGMGVRGGGDEQAHRSCAWVSSRIDDGRRDLAVTCCDGRVQR